MALAVRTSTSPNTCPKSYHVFLSFRGEETRKTFTDHLYTAFVNSGFRTFRDDEEISKGQGIEPEIRKAIKQSRSSVIVFSKDYASSGWCLDELVMIMERKRTADHIVLPVFYDVNPSHVRKQTGDFAKALARHERDQSLTGKVKRWREALAEVADLAGMVLQNEAAGHESKFIKKIVRVIEDKLRRIPLSVEPHLIGIDFQTREINDWLQDGSADVDMLLLHGMRGIGKSTIAKFVYNSNFLRFERCSYLENIREVSEQPNGLLRLQKQLLDDILRGSKAKIHNISEGIAKIEDAVSSRRVFLVLDDVDHVDQLAALLRMKNRFHPGSKIIITSSCAGLLEAHCQFAKVHKVRILNKNKAFALFSWHAFGKDHPIDGYVDHSKRVIDHCGGLPLALKVLGASLSGKINLAVWESALKKLEVIPNGEVMKKLKISYESIQDDHDKNLFLHIACFFIGMEKTVVLTILDACGFFTEVGIQNLIDRCLVSIDKDTKLVQMHDIIRDMGREIVRLESKEPEKRSRLWHPNDSFQVLSQNIGTQTIEGLVLNMQMHPTLRNSSKLVLETNAFTVMRKLRLLQLSDVHLSGRYEELPAGLRWFSMSKFPSTSLPSDFPLERLVALEMCYSSLRQLWRGVKYLPSLTILNLSHSHEFTEIPDFSCIPKLERLVLEGCARLTEIHESIGVLESLNYLSVKDCKNLRKLPDNISILTLLETLNISGCSSLREFPTEMMKIQSLKVFQADGVPIHRLIGTTSTEVKLCSSPIRVISWASHLPRYLVILSLRNCNLSDDDFPRDFGNLFLLQSLDLSGNPISGLPDSIRGLTGLQKISLIHCMKLKSLEGLSTELLSLQVVGCTSLERIRYQSPPRKFSSDFGSNYKLLEVQNWYKLEAIEKVDKEMLNLLSLNNLESLETIWMETFWGWNSWKGMRPVQGLYEDGIFSTFLPGDEVPGQFNHRSRGSSISFTVPLLSDLSIQGLKIFTVVAKSNNNDNDPMTNTANKDGSDCPTIIVVSNKSKGLKWSYSPIFFGVPTEGKDVIWLSHWKLENRLEGGDEVAILIYTKSKYKVKECGVQLVHSTMVDPCFLRAGVSSTIPFQINPSSFICHDRSIVLDMDFIRDINEKSEKEVPEGDIILTLAAQSGNNSNSNKRGFFSGWKGIMMATVFLLSLPLVARSAFFQHPRKQRSTSPP